VRDFIYSDLSKYENTEFKSMKGNIELEAKFYNKEGKLVEKTDLQHLTRAELNELMTMKGMKLKSTSEHNEF